MRINKMTRIGKVKEILLVFDDYNQLEYIITEPIYFRIKYMYENLDNFIKNLSVYKIDKENFINEFVKWN